MRTSELDDPRLSRGLLRRAYELAGVGAYTIDLTRRTIHLSCEMAWLLRAGDETLDMPLEEFRSRFFPDDQDEALRDRAYAQGRPLRVELRVLRGDGEIIWIESSSNVERDADGEPLVVGVVRDVTQTKHDLLRLEEQAAMLERASRKVRAGEALLRQFVTHTPAAVAMFDTSMRYLHASDRWLIDYHLTGQDLVGRCHYDVFPELPERWREIHRRALAGAVERCDEEPWPRSDGTIEWLAWEIRPWRTDAGKIGGVIVFTQVITERRRADERLRDSEQRFRMLSEHALVGIYIVQCGRLSYVNPSLERTLGYEPGEMLALGKPCFLHPEDRRFVTEHGAAARAVRGVRKDGSIVELELLGFTAEIDGAPAIIGNVLDVTERERALRQLRASEEWFRRLTEQSLAGIYIAQDERFVYANAALERILGAAPGTLAGTHPLAQIDPEDRPIVIESIERRASGEVTSDQYEARALTRDGRRIWLQVLGNAMLHGERPAVFGNVLDITARKQAEAELQRAELRWRTFLEEAPIAVGARRGRIAIYGNRRFRELFGYRPLDEVIGRPTADHWAPDDDQPYAPGDKIFERTALRRDGSRFPARVEVVLLELPDGPAEIAFFTDLTEQRRAAHAMRQTEARFRQIEETIDEVFWVLDPIARELLYVSPAFEKIWGRPVRSLEHDAWPQALAAEDEARVLATARARQLAGEYDETYRIRRPDGTVRWIRDRGFPIRNAAGEVFRIVGTASDVTAQQELEDQLRQAQKMEAIGVLAGGVAHDFNNLLAVIISYSAMLIDDLSPGDPMRDDLQEIQTAADRATQMTRQLLAFSRRQVLEPRSLDLNAVLAGTEKMLRRMIGEDIALTTLPSPTPAHAFVDPGQIQQVLMNLAVNARDAMPGGGRLGITVAQVALESAEAARLGVQPGGFVTLAVSDTGSGMDAATRARIFEPFFTTKATGKGTGLGLSTVFGIVRQSGGQVEVESELGRGSIFRVWLPLAEDAPVAAPPAAVAAAPHRAETILLVEDEDAVRKLTHTILARRGYRVLEARSPCDALVMCEEFQGEIHLVLTDMVMPLMSGEQMVTRLRALRPGIQVAFMSGYPDKGSERGSLAAPAVFIQKPFTPDSLLARISEVLATPAC